VGSLGPLNPFPWTFCAGNCLGWVVYGYYTRDPFVLAANLPGLVLSIWLNSGAAKLQYLELTERRQRYEQQQANNEHWDASGPLDTTEVSFLSEREQVDLEDACVMVPQERALMRILSLWAVVIVYVGWFSRSNPATVVGLVVNLNLIFFYAAPLQTMHKVIATSNSDSIHIPTMVMNWTNTSFWIGYGIARKDPIILIPNVLGLLLGLAQGVLRFLYPSQSSGAPNSDAVPVLVSQQEDTGMEDAAREHHLPVPNKGGNGSVHHRPSVSR
jgi:solute carrier family 50 (sugar transporter)